MAKIAFTADLHIGSTSAYHVRTMVKELATQELDAIVIAGDLGEPLRDFGDCLKLFKPLNCPIGVLAGNHDVWAVGKKPPFDSDSIFKNHLPKVARENGCVWLEEDNIILKDGVAIAGSIAWYDYSLRASETKDWSEEKFATEKHKHNNDAIFINWPHTDPAFSKSVGDALLERLEKLEADPSVKKIAVATHVPVFEKQVMISTGKDAASSSYFGQVTLGQKLLKFSKLTAVVSGHTHFGVAPFAVERAPLPPLTAQTLASATHFPNAITLEI